MFLFVCLLDCSLEFLIDWFIDWLAKMFMKLKLHVFWWWEISWFSLVLLYLKISTRIPKSSRVKECSLAVFSAVSRKLSSDNFQILSMNKEHPADCAVSKCSTALRIEKIVGYQFLSDGQWDSETTALRGQASGWTQGKEKCSKEVWS